MSHVQTHLFIRTNESWHTIEWATTHIQRNHIARIHQLYNTYEYHFTLTPPTRLPQRGVTSTSSYHTTHMHVSQCVKMRLLQCDALLSMCCACRNVVCFSQCVALVAMCCACRSVLRLSQCVVLVAVCCACRNVLRFPQCEGTSASDCIMRHVHMQSEISA